mmetsp:Transcript_10971/g.19590  ORF Transcript_10971/g.19590 Transcript_10971/m.19590 type:complete len:84 (+) Transcript_10971:951-1202(+)
MLCTKLVSTPLAPLPAAGSLAYTDVNQPNLTHCLTCTVYGSQSPSKKPCYPPPLRARVVGYYSPGGLQGLYSHPSICTLPFVP